MDQVYSFYCARYENIPYSDFLKLGLTDFMRKFTSIPESEPLYKIIKSRTMDVGKIKDKQERKYWRDLKKANKIPDLYFTTGEILEDMSKEIKEIKK